MEAYPKTALRELGTAQDLSYSERQLLKQGAVSQVATERLEATRKQISQTERYSLPLMISSLGLNLMLAVLTLGGAIGPSLENMAYAVFLISCLGLGAGLQVARLAGLRRKEVRYSALVVRDDRGTAV